MSEFDCLGLGLEAGLGKGSADGLCMYSNKMERKRGNANVLSHGVSDQSDRGNEGSCVGLLWMEKDFTSVLYWTAR